MQLHLQLAISIFSLVNWQSLVMQYKAALYCTFEDTAHHQCRTLASIDCHLFTADVEFGRLQARDLLQHLWTGPISNAPVNIVQGSKSVEVRPVGISKVSFCFVTCLYPADFRQAHCDLRLCQL